MPMYKCASYCDHYETCSGKSCILEPPEEDPEEMARDYLDNLREDMEPCPVCKVTSKLFFTTLIPHGVRIDCQECWFFLEFSISDRGRAYRDAIEQWNKTVSEMFV